MDRDSTQDVEMDDATPAPGVATDANTVGSKDKTSSATAPSGAPPYRSWKKKFQKMRYAFEDKMAANEKLHTQEVKAIQTSKRLAVEIDRILDLLLDVNNSPQIPAARRIDLSLLPPASSRNDDDNDDSEHHNHHHQHRYPSLDFDKKDGWAARFYDKKDKEHPYPSPPAKSLQTLLKEVPHADLASTKKRNPDLLKDLVAGDDNKLAFTVPRGTTPQSSYPESFLTADDIDNYLWEVDRTIAGNALVKGNKPPPMLPTLAPFAQTSDMHTAAGERGWTEFFNKSILTKDLPSIYSASPLTTTRDAILRNPTSVYNWLKKYAPKSIFLQEGEATAQAAAAAAASSGENGDDRYHHHHNNGGSSSNHGNHSTSSGRNGTPSTSRGRKSAAAAAESRKSEAGSASASTTTTTTTTTGRKPMGAISGGRWAAQQRKRASAAMAAAAAAAAAEAAAGGSASGGTTGRDGTPDSRQAGDELDPDDVSMHMATPRTMANAASTTTGTKRGRASTGSTGASGGRGTKRKRKSEGGADGKGDAAAAPVSASTKRARKNAGTRSSYAELADVETEVEAEADEMEVEEAEAEVDTEADGDGGAATAAAAAADTEGEAASEEAASPKVDDAVTTPVEA